jgi:1-acyl-sn-glycerol-3-phosphate acyltransferase
MITVRSIVFYLGMSAMLLVFSLVAVLVIPLPYRWRYYIVTRWTMFTLWWLERTCGLGFRVTGKENIPPGPAIIMCKHQSAWETMALQKIFPPHIWVLKKELRWIPMFGWGIATLEPIFIDRQALRTALRQILQEGAQRLSAGRWVLIFPEGTRVAPGEKRRYTVSGGLLAEKTGYPVVPVAHNAGLFWPRKSIKKYPGVIGVVIGPTLDSKGKSAAEIMSSVEQWIEAASDQLLRNTPDPTSREPGPFNRTPTPP